MRRGTTTINLTFEIEFADDGNDAEVLAIRSDGHLVAAVSEPFLTDALPEALWEQVKADAWEDAVDEGTTMYREMTRGEKMADEDYDADDGEFCGRAG